MAYIIVQANGEEIDRVPLTEDLVIGRSPECQVAVRDVLMSRRHLRLECRRGRWYAVDLNSKNGTRLGWERISQIRLHDGDLLRVGRTEILFQAGEFVPSEAPAPRRDRLIRPADPFEALSGTVSGFVLDEPDPTAEPPQSPWLADRAADPASAPSFAAELAESVSEMRLASSRRETDRWTPSRSTRTYNIMRPTHRPTDLSLQVRPELDMAVACPSRLARLSDQALFLIIFVCVTTLLSGGMLVATWAMAGR